MQLNNVGLEALVHAHPTPISSSPWLLTLKNEPGAQVRVVCFASIATDVAMFKSLAKLVPAGWAVYGAQLPGRDGRRKEAALTSIAEAADHVTQALLTLPVCKTVLFGYSFGGNVAFEVAHRLREAGQAPARLIVAAARSPEVGVPENDGASVRAMSSEEFGAHMLRMGLISPELAGNTAILSHVLPVMQADLTALQEHRLVERPTLDVPMHVFLATQDTVNLPHMSANWATHGTAVTVTRVDASHYFYKPCLDQLVRAVVLG